MNRKEMINEIAKKSKMTKKDINKCLDSFIDVFSETLKNGDKIVITGFGSFEIRQRIARKGINPNTGEEMNVKEQKTLAYKVAKPLKKYINS